MNWFLNLLSFWKRWEDGYEDFIDTTINPLPTTPLDAVMLTKINPKPMTNQEKLVAAAKNALGENLSKGTGVPPQVACAISVNVVHNRAFGYPIGGGASTAELYQALLVSPYFKQVEVPVSGCVVISPTGQGTNPMYPHGHVGIVGNYGICSNDSETGLFSENYNAATWRNQFSITEGYPIYWFERI